MNLNLVESNRIEFKRVLRDKDLKEVIAFLNTNGGYIYVGIGDNGEVIGI